MSRKKLVLLALPVVAALAAAGVATAGSSHPAVQAASATFAATTVSHSHQATCSKNGGDTYERTTATYTGTATSADARLDGTLTIRAHSLVDTTTGLGRVSGVLRVVGANGSRARAVFRAAVAGGKATGLARGIVQHPFGRLLASFASDFSPTGGFSSGALGSGSAANIGVVSLGGWCTHHGPVHPLRHKIHHLRKEVHRLRHRLHKQH